MATETVTSGAMTDEDVAALLATSKTKGQYSDLLKQFVESGERGHRYSISDGQFAGKALQSVNTGFKNAVKAASLEGHVRVIGSKDGGFVALVNTQA